MDPAQLARLEWLIDAIYAPTSTPNAIKQAQNELLAAQRSELGWAIASDLMKASNANAQFLGAVTFTMNINDDKKGLPEGIRAEILHWLQQAAQSGNMILARKLIVTATQLFFRTYTTWPSFLEDTTGAVYPNFGLVALACQTVVEEYSMLHANLTGLRAVVEEMVPFVGSFVEQQVTSVAPDRYSFLQSSLEVYLPWAQVFFARLSPLLPAIIGLLKVPDYGTLDLTCTTLADLFELNAAHWHKSTKDLLRREFLSVSQPFDSQLSRPLGYLALTICREDFKGNTDLVPYILQVTASAEPLVEDQLALDVLQFWCSFVEDIVFEGMDSDYNPLIEQVIGIYWGRIQLSDTSEETWNELSIIRRDFADFIEAAYQLLGIDLLQKLVDYALLSLNLPGAHITKDENKVDWAASECALYCLSALADILGDDPRTTALLRTVFSAEIWQRLAHTSSLPIRYTAVSTIGAYSRFFDSPDQEQFLKPALDYLFANLAYKQMQPKASRSIESLCSSNSKVLSKDTRLLLQAFSSVASSLAPVAIIRVAAAISSVIQALGPSDHQAEATLFLIKTVEDSKSSPVDVMRCFAAMAKAFQDSSDHPPESLKLSASSFYGPDPLNIRQHLLAYVEQCSGSDDPDMCEPMCSLFKYGLRERLLSPFTLGPVATMSFITGVIARGSVQCLPYVMNLAVYFTSTQIADKTLDHEMATSLLALANPKAQPESLKLMTAVARGAPDAFVNSPILKSLLEFAAGSLTSMMGRFVIKAASDFWCAFLMAEGTQSALEAIGPQLVRAITMQISGEAERGELEYSTDILKKLVLKQPLLTGQWLKDTIANQNVNSPNLERVGHKARTDFVTQVMLLRGGRRTNDLVKKFWLASRGIPDY